MGKVFGRVMYEAFSVCVHPRILQTYQLSKQKLKGQDAEKRVLPWMRERRKSKKHNLMYSQSLYMFADAWLDGV